MIEPTKSNSRPRVLLGSLLAMFGAANGTLPKLRAFTKPRSDRPAQVVDWLKARARAKRARRAAKPDATAYARGNVR